LSFPFVFINILALFRQLSMLDIRFHAKAQSSQRPQSRTTPNPS